MARMANAALAVTVLTVAGAIVWAMLSAQESRSGD